MCHTMSHPKSMHQSQTTWCTIRSIATSIPHRPCPKSSLNPFITQPELRRSNTHGTTRMSSQPVLRCHSLASTNHWFPTLTICSRSSITSTCKPPRINGTRTKRCSSGKVTCKISKRWLRCKMTSRDRSKSRRCYPRSLPLNPKAHLSQTLKVKSRARKSGRVACHLRSRPRPRCS